MNKLFDYLKKVYGEMRKVTWPTRSELLNSTIVVIAISGIVAVIIFILDTIFSSALSLIIK
ncbi:preprotein translocase subunit SecE [candidate division WOR-3 bacterium 4484_100]|uniref:Protein translocase subunit SecE n=1 Tax=candidate division WOR-3 bacterium 4484_100 TaxID=1936077 RepID=A0A1V4QG85_UNCW3|nr:MAG: preprotein translocase subunit SecE [candidate division WOR-3 bacterium 4484_100]